MTTIETPAPYKMAKVRAQMVKRGKSSGGLGLGTEILSVGVQVVSPLEGETNLHSHIGVDEVWFVLDGEATFYGTDDDVLIGVLGKNEGITVPAGSPYWFKCSSEKPLVIMRIGAKTPGAPPAGQSSRVNYKPEVWHAEESHAEIIPGAFWEG